MKFNPGLLMMQLNQATKFARNPEKNGVVPLDTSDAKKLFRCGYYSDEEIELISKVLRENSAETGINIYDYL